MARRSVPVVQEEGRGCELTPRLLNIPHAVTCRYAAVAPPGSNRYDEAVSVGYLALVKGSRYYDPGNKAGASPVTYLFACVGHAVHRFLNRKPRYRTNRDGSVVQIMPHEDRWASLESLDCPIPDDGGTLGDIIASRQPDPSHHVDVRDAARHVLANLEPEERELLLARVVEGKTGTALTPPGTCRRTTYGRCKRVLQKASKMTEDMKWD